MKRASLFVPFILVLTLLMVACGPSSSPDTETLEPAPTIVPLVTLEEVRPIITPRASSVNVLDFLEIRYDEENDEVVIKYSYIFDQDVEVETLRKGVGETEEWQQVADYWSSRLIEDLSLGNRSGQYETKAHWALKHWELFVRGDEGVQERVQIKEGDRFIAYSAVFQKKGERFFSMLERHPLGTVIEIRERKGNLLKAVVYSPGEDPWEMEFGRYLEYGTLLEMLVGDIALSGLPDGRQTTFSDGDRIFISLVTLERVQ